MLSRKEIPMDENMQQPTEATGEKTSQTTSDANAEHDNASAIAVDGVEFRYGHRGPGRRKAPLVLKNVSLDVAAGDILCLLGPSGCGKTTLVNLIMGVDVPTSGTVRVLGEKAPFRTARKRMGFMP